MLKARWRKTSIIVFLVFAVVGAGASTVVAAASRPEAVRRLWAVATFDQTGNARVVETIDYHFTSKRHGIFRVLPDLPITEASKVVVHADTTDQAMITPEASGMRIRIGDPNRTISGDHRYSVSYPLSTLDLGGRRYGWNGVGTAWEVGIESTELDMVAPWKWENPSCDKGNAGSFGGCTVSQPEPGHLVVSFGALKKFEGLTIYANRGAPLAAAPAPRQLGAQLAPPDWWTRPWVVGLLAGLALLLSALVTSRVLRHYGRDWVMSAAADTGDAAGLAFKHGGNFGGSQRVDDRELAGYATTEFAPPTGLTAWQGGVVLAESNRPEHRTAWLLGAAADGYVELDETGTTGVVVRAKEHPVDATTALLGVGFAGRSSLRLGAYDPRFSAMWQSLPPLFEQWYQSSGFEDIAAGKRVTVARSAGAAAVLLGGILLFVSIVALTGFPLGRLVGVGVAGILLGSGLACLFRGWELRVRTPAGSALWLRVESFRRFLANSESHHVEEAAKRGVLRDYTAWAVSLDEVKHWSKMVAEAGLPPSTAGLSTAMMASSLGSSVSSTATAPSSSGGGGGGGGSGGGGGGGGGGSW